MKSIASLLILLIAMLIISSLMGVFQVVEEVTVAIAFIGASVVMFVILFLWNLVRNQPTRVSSFKIWKQDVDDRTLGQQGDGLPLLTDTYTWWRGYIFLESETPIEVIDLQLKLKRQRYSAFQFGGLRLEGAHDIHFQFYYFPIPVQTKFGDDKAEIIAVTKEDDYGSGDKVLRN